MNLHDLAATYDQAAPAYAATFADELDRKPFDRALLDAFARRWTRGLVLDIGCGPGHVGRYLAGHGVDTGGADLSTEMTRVARGLYPTMPFVVAELRSLPARDAHLGGITAFYSLIHLPRFSLPLALAELRRALRRGAPLLVAVHAGTGGLHADEFLGRPADLDVTLHDRDELTVLLEDHDFEIEDVQQRRPYPFEYPTERLYVFASAGGSPR